VTGERLHVAQAVTRCRDLTRPVRDRRSSALMGDAIERQPVATRFGGNLRYREFRLLDDR